MKNSGFSYLYGSVSYLFGYEKNRCFSLMMGERAGSICTRRCAELLAVLRVCIVRNLSAQYPPRMQQPQYAPDGDQRKSPEIATGRRTSPSADACPTLHALREDTASPSPPRARQRNEHACPRCWKGACPTYAAHPRCQSLSPRTHAAT